MKGEMKVNLHFIFISLVIILAAPLAFPETDSIYTKVNGDSVTIWHAQTSRNCASSFVMAYEPDGFNIKVIEYDTSSVRYRCMCNYDLSLTLGPLLPGSYTAEIISIDNLYSDTAGYGKIEFEIEDSETEKLSQLQSDCYYAPEKPAVFSPGEFYPFEDSLYAEVNGYSVKLWHTHLIQNCASKFYMSYEQDNHYIKVIELDTVMFRYDCICEYDLLLEIGSMDPGIYTAEFIQRGVLRADSFSYGKINFEIKVPADGALKKSQYQSACYDVVSSVNPENETLPDEYILYPLYPNPFNPETNIEYYLPQPGLAEISVYDINGRKLETLLYKETGKGKGSLKWNAGKYASGVYYIYLYTGDKIKIQKALLIK